MRFFRFAYYPVSSKSAKKESNNPSSNTSMASSDLVFNDTDLHSEFNSTPNNSPSAVIRQRGTLSSRDKQYLQLVGCVVSVDPRKRYNYRKKLKT